ncbi:MAG: hypothetical protein IJM38_03300 [Ruminococcus sp.]|nr:hypothetical protein [Ruminococcus sp.]
MKDLLNSYEKSRALVKERLSQLNSLRREYKHQGNKEAIEQLDLDRRISLLQTENIELTDIIDRISGYIRRAEERVET